MTNLSEIDMRNLLFIFLLIGSIPLSIYSQDTLTKKEFRKQQKSFLIEGKPWTVEVPLWIPGFSGSFAYGDINVEGEDGQEIENPIEPPPPFDWGNFFGRIFSTDWYLKFFFLTKVAYEKNRFLGQFDAIAGSVGESTDFNYNQKTVVQLNFRTINMRLFGGYKILNIYGKKKKFRYELFGYLGVRAHFHRVYSGLDESTNKLDISPSYFEPIIGIQNQFTWKRWFIVIQGDYGGFFINSKYSYQGSTYVYYRSGKITSLKLGWNHLVMNHKGNFNGEDYKVNVNLSGPSAGIAFHF